MSYRVLMWALAAVLLVAAVTAFDIYRERREGGPIFREGRYFQVMGSKDQQTGHFTIDSQTGRLRGWEDDD
jgi:hypothetical protein